MNMNAAVATANLVGITGIARRLVLDGALDEAAARDALDKATAARKPIAPYLREPKLVTPAQMAAANPAHDRTTAVERNSASARVDPSCRRSHTTQTHSHQPPLPPHNHTPTNPPTTHPH